MTGYSCLAEQCKTEHCGPCLNLFLLGNSGKKQGKCRWSDRGHPELLEGLIQV